MCLYTFISFLVTFLVDREAWLLRAAAATDRLLFGRPGTWGHPAGFSRTGRGLGNIEILGEC